MPGFYDDNFGHWDVDSQEDVEFYFQVQRTSVEKECLGCGRMVRIMPQYAYCDACASMIERGVDI